MNFKVEGKIKSFILQHMEKVSHLFGRIGPVDCTCTAVHWVFAVGTSRSICYLEKNTSKGGEVNRTMIIKNEIICNKICGSPLQSRQPRSTQLRCGPRVLCRWYWNYIAVSCVIWKGIQVEEDRWVGRKSKEKWNHLQKSCDSPLQPRRPHWTQ